MTVSIPISADAVGVVRALDQINEALRRTTEEGRRFSELELGHPELGDLSAEMLRVGQNFADLTRLGRGSTAAAARAISGGRIDDPAAGWAAFQRWQNDYTRHFPDPNEAARHFQNVGGYVLQGTSWAPGPAGMPPPPPPAGGGGGSAGFGSAYPGQPTRSPVAGPPSGSGGGRGGGGGEGESGMGALGGVLGGFLGPAKFMLTMAGMGGLASMAAKSANQAMDESVGNDRLFRNLGDVGTSFDELKQNARDASRGLALTYGETQRLALTFTKLANMSDPDLDVRKPSGASQGRRALDAAVFGAGFARGYGMDAAGVVGSMAQANFAGQDPRAFALMIAEAVQQGNLGGHQEEVMQSLLSWSQTSARFMMTQGAVQDALPRFAAMYAGLNATGDPGVRGGNAEQLIGQVNSSVMRGGAAGLASQVVTMRAFARAGVTDPFQIQYALGGGMFAHLNGQGSPTIFQGMMSEINRQYGTPSVNGQPNYRRLHAIAQMFGISERQAAEMDKMGSADMGRLAGGLSFLNPGEQDALARNPSGLAEISRILDPGANLNAIRGRMLERRDLSDTEKKSLDGLSGDDLRRGMVRLLATHGMENTEGSNVTKSMADFSNALTAAGTGLVPVLTDLKGVLGDLLAMLGGASSQFARSYEKGWVVNGRQWGGAAGGGAGSSGGGGGVTKFSQLTSVGQARANYALSFLTAHGVSAENAEGVVANLLRESGLNPHADNGTHHGIMQWDTTRQAEFAKWAGHDIRQSSIDEQLAFILHERDTGSDPQSAAAWKQMAGKGRRESAIIFGQGAERYNDPNEDAARGGLAESMDGNGLSFNWKQGPTWGGKPLLVGPGDQAPGAHITSDPVTVIVQHPNGATTTHEVPTQVVPTPAPSGGSAPPAPPPAVAPGPAPGVRVGGTSDMRFVDGKPHPRETPNAAWSDTRYVHGY